MKAVGRAPVVPPALRGLYEMAQRVILRHQPVIADRPRCSFCGETWQCEASVLAEQAQRVALYLVLTDPAIVRVLPAPAIPAVRDV